jgi:branched-subunit amino acid aminotransferase/4-amino-4-deoxychorismate lyase
MIWLNGQLRDADNALSTQDRGLLLGESVFETLLVSKGVPQFWQAHLARLAAACDAFDLDNPYREDALRAGVVALLAAHEATERAVLRLTITGGGGAGKGGRGLVPYEKSQANVILQVSPAPPRPAALRLADCAVTRFAGGASSAHKTGAYLDNIMARKQVLAAGADEAVMMNQYGRIACAAAGNIFIARGNRLLTPPVSEGALPGIIRGALLALGAVAGIKIDEALLDENALEQAEAIFVTNSVNGVIAAAYEATSPAQKKQGHVLNEALPKFVNF